MSNSTLTEGSDKSKAPDWWFQTEYAKAVDYTKPELRKKVAPVLKQFLKDLSEYEDYEDFFGDTPLADPNEHILTLAGVLYDVFGYKAYGTPDEMILLGYIPELDTDVRLTTDCPKYVESVDDLLEQILQWQKLRGEIRAKCQPRN